MATKISVLALLLALVALGVAAFHRPQERAGPAVSDARLDALEAQMAALARAVEERNAWAPELPGLEGRASRTHAGPAAGPAADAAAGSGEGLEALVDAAVEKKAREVVDRLETKENKKPSMDVFASTLGLTDEQRRAAEREVIRAQREILTLLDTPTADGSNFLDELVEVYARRIAKPDEDPGWNRWLMRLIAERVPGSDETYAERAEAVKGALKAAFKRDWSEKQYAEFEAWQMDPTEIREIEGSPYEEIGRRIADRAKQLGAKLAEEDGE